MQCLFFFQTRNSSLQFLFVIIIAPELSTVIIILKISKRFFEDQDRVEIIRLVTKMKELHNMMTWPTDAMQVSDSKLPIMYTLYILLWLSLFIVLQGI